MNDIVIADGRTGGDKHCFYCHESVGSVHLPDCVLLKRMVRVRMVVEYDISVPCSWDKHMIEFHRNDGSWCADNALGELEDISERDGCLCHATRYEYLGESTPDDSEG